MRVLIVQHGPPATGASPTTGGALRAGWLRQALSSSGNDVNVLCREQDGPGGFRGPSHLRALAQTHNPDWILCVAPEEAPALRGLAPLVVDLYAPRLLEAAFSGQQQDEARIALLAIDAADEVLFSNDRQRVFWLGILGLAGWNLAKPLGITVPLVADHEAVPPRAPRQKTSDLPVVICGGQPWPWQDARAALAQAAKHLAGRARVVSFGIPEVPGVEAHPLCSRATWLAACRDATVALDRYERHQERELALSFRQMDYLAAGLPIVSDPWTPLAQELRDHHAGEVDLPLAAALDQYLDPTSPASRRAKKGVAVLNAQYSIAAVQARLPKAPPPTRIREWSAVQWSAEAAEAVVAARADRTLREAAEQEVQYKRAEVSSLVETTRGLSSAVEQLSAAMADVAGFRRETVAVLGTRLQRQTDETEHLRRELAIAHAELEKKQAELARLTAERDRMGGVLSRLARR